MVINDRHEKFAKLYDEMVTVGIQKNNNWQSLIKNGGLNTWIINE